MSTCSTHGETLICPTCAYGTNFEEDFESGRWWPVVLVLFGIVLLSFAQVAVDQWTSGARRVPDVASADVAQQVEGLTFYGNTITEMEPAPRASGTTITLDRWPMIFRGELAPRGQEGDHWDSTTDQRSYIFKGGQWRRYR